MVNTRYTLHIFEQNKKISITITILDNSGDPVLESHVFPKLSISLRIQNIYLPVATYAGDEIQQVGYYLLQLQYSVPCGLCSCCSVSATVLSHSFYQCG